MNFFGTTVENKDPSLERVYKIYILDTNKNPKQIIVFNGKREPITSLSEVFSEIEIAEIRANQTVVKYSSSQIHKDDSIQTIKKKILLELEMVSLHEIYMFSKIRDNLHLSKFFLDFTQNGKVEFQRNMFGQLLRNLLSGEEALSKIETIPEKDNYTYEDLAIYLDISKEHEINIPIGQKFSVFRDLLFSADPFDILPSNKYSYQQSAANSIFTFENHLLLNYGDLIDNKIYVCLADDVLDYSTTMGINDEYIIRLYFPLLEKADILTRVDFETRKQELIMENKELLNDDVLKFYDRVDMFYDIFNNKTTELDYTNQGITSFDIILHPEFKVILPLEAMFKNIHANELMPFIKYNPGPKRENLYRLYSDKISKTGKKIPFLKKSVIMNLAKSVGKINQISMYITSLLDSIPVEIFVDFEQNGNVNVKCELKQPITEEGVLRILLGPVNNIINETNDFLLQTGYKMNVFRYLKDDFVEIINLKHMTEINLRKPFQLTDGIGCLTSIFDIIDTDLKKGAILRFKRVENFKKMDGINAMIAEMYSKTGDINSIINSLIINYNVSKDEALIRFQEFLNQYTRIQGRYINKSVDIAENPGFPATFRIITFENRLLIEIDKINGIDYISTIELYLDSYLRLSQAPDTLGFPIETIKQICSKSDKPVDENYSENVITTTKTYAPEIDYQEDESDNEEDDLALVPIEEYEFDEEDDNGLMPMEEEDEEEQEDNEESKDNDNDEEEGEENIEGDEEGHDNDEEEGEENIEGDEEGQETDMNEDEQEPGPIVYKTTSETQDNEKVIDENIPEIQEPNPIVYKTSPVVDNSTTEDDSIESEDSGLAPMKDSLESETTVTPEQNKHTGGLPKKANLDVKPGKFFINKMHRLDPKLILTHKEGVFPSYASACQVTANRQPVILTDEEKQKIDETHRGAYNYALRFGTDPNKKYWYICPRFWCMKTNMPMTEEEVKQGKCDGNYHEFSSNKHFDKDGKYINYKPGFLPEGSHPSSCLPCCFKKEWDSNQLENRRNQCNILPEDIDFPEGVVPKERPVVKKRVVEEVDNPILYIVGFNQRLDPIPKDRWGFLPPSIQLFLNIDYTTVISKKNAALIKPNKSVFLRYGVEQSVHQSFIGCIADIFGSVNRYKAEKRPIPTISEMRNIIASSITLDIYLKCHNGSLVSIFQPKKKQIEQATINKYTESEFYKSLDPTKEEQMDFFEDTIASFENFLEYLRDDDSWIDHTYLWDIITMNNSKLFPGGLNLVIMNIMENDITDNVEILCPTNSYVDRYYDPRRETALLIKHDDFFEPIYLFENIVEDKANIVKSVETFSEQLALPSLKKMLKIIENTIGKYCRAQPSMPKVYKMKQNLPAIEILRTLKTYQYIIVAQVMNYRGKIIGFNVSENEESTQIIFIPCLPSAILPDIKSILMDDVVWLNYETTRDILLKINKSTDYKILCKPVIKVVEKIDGDEIGLIVGIYTETNQFIQIDPPIANDIDDDLEVFNSYAHSHYLEADKAFTTSSGRDNIRTTTIRNISLESQFYSAFRTTLRILLNDNSNTEVRTKLIELINDMRFMYKTKIKKMVILLKYVLRNAVSFSEFSPEILSDIKEISTCTSKCDAKKYCIMRENDNCSLIVPIKNLVTDKENEPIYYARLADEIMRYKRIRLFLLEPKKFLNISNGEYNLNDSEVILLQSILNDDYFDDLVPFQTNKYVNKINYDFANPAITQKYDQFIPLSKQGELNSENTNMDIFVVECVKETLKSVIGNKDSFWKRVFPESAKEVVFNDSVFCSFFVLIDIIQKRLSNPVSVQTLKAALWKKYSLHMDKHKSKILDILSIQGKREMMKRVKTSRISLQDLISSEEYFLTNLDLWALASYFNLPILLFSVKPLQNLLLDVNWVILGGNRITDKYYCVRSPSITKKLPEYHLITPSFGIRELKGFEGMINNVEYAENNLSFESYLDTHNFDLTKIAEM